LAKVNVKLMVVLCEKPNIITWQRNYFY